MLNKNKSWWYFALILGIFGVVAYFLIRHGNAIDVALHRSVAEGTEGTLELFKNLTLHNLMEPAAMILLQIIAILIVSRIFSAVFAKIQQPTVIGEILAGIVLGPSLLGMIFPEA